jgi:hypothetical protein
MSEEGGFFYVLGGALKRAVKLAAQRNWQVKPP